MASDLPLVSIIIPFVEDRGWLNEAIKSVKSQSYPSNRIELLLQKSPNTVGHNINKGIARAQGKYIKYFAEDDWLEPNCVMDSVEFLIDNPQFKWMHANAIIHWVDGPRKGAKQYYAPPHNPTLEQLRTFNHINGGTVMYEAEMLKKFRFDETLMTGEEYDLYLQIYSSGYAPGYLDEYVFNYRRHEKQKSLGNTDPRYQDWRRRVVEQIRERYK